MYISFSVRVMCYFGWKTATVSLFELLLLLYLFLLFHKCVCFIMYC